MDNFADSQVVLVSALRENGWQLPRILASVPHKTFDSIKLDLVSPFLADGGFVQAASLVQELLEKISTEQLHLVVRIRREEAHDTLFAWYSLLHWLFFKRRFVLFAAEQSGLCGRQIDQCRYQLSYVRLPPGGTIPFEAPIFGMSKSSPLLFRFTAAIFHASCVHTTPDLPVNSVKKVERRRNAPTIAHLLFREFCAKKDALLRLALLLGFGLGLVRERSEP